MCQNEERILVYVAVLMCFNLQNDALNRLIFYGHFLPHLFAILLKNQATRCLPAFQKRYTD
jgi:hypothetical protein